MVDQNPFDRNNHITGRFGIVCGMIVIIALCWTMNQCNKINQEQCNKAIEAKDNIAMLRTCSRIQ